MKRNIQNDRQFCLKIKDCWSPLIELSDLGKDVEYTLGKIDVAGVNVKKQTKLKGSIAYTI